MSSQHTAERAGKPVERSGNGSPAAYAVHHCYPKLEGPRNIEALAIQSSPLILVRLCLGASQMLTLDEHLDSAYPNAQG